jgi:mannosyltransferase OCH1-like enzyme
MIPKIIHQIWVGPKKMPEKYMKTWKDMNPEWEHIIWDDKMISEKYPKGFRNQSKIDEIEEWAGKADIMRYEILHDFGGIYIDADSICTNSLDEHFLKHDSFACFENEQCRGNLIANGYIGAVKYCKLMQILIEKISKLETVSFQKTGKMAWQCVGPLLFTETIFERNYPISVYPSFVFIPEHYSGIKYEGNGKSYSKQFWGSTHEFRDPEYYNNL